MVAVVEAVVDGAEMLLLVVMMVVVGVAMVLLVGKVSPTLMFGTLLGGRREQPTWPF
jgi:hypothetical protein